MNVDKTIFKSRSFQLLGLLLVMQLYLIFEQILPAYDKIPYFRSKIETSKQEKFNLEINHDHLAYYKLKEKGSLNRLNDYHAHIRNLKTPTYLQSRINALSQISKLEIVNQHIKTDGSNSELFRIYVCLTLEGYYKELIAFIDEAGKMDPFITISEIEMINQSPLVSNPKILTKVVLTVYLPNIT